MSKLETNTTGLNAIKALVNSLPDYVDPATAPIPSDAITALTDKGVTVPSGADVSTLAGLIAAIEAGGSVIAIKGSVTCVEGDTAFVPLDAVKYQGEYYPEVIALYEKPEVSIREQDSYLHGAIILAFQKNTQFPTRTSGYESLNSVPTSKLFYGAVATNLEGYPYIFSGNINWVVSSQRLVINLGGYSAKPQDGSTWEYLCVWGL